MDVIVRFRAVDPPDGFVSAAGDEAGEAGREFVGWLGLLDALGDALRAVTD